MVTQDEVYRDSTLRTAAIAAVILGLTAAIFFIYYEQESYSALYILPNSIAVGQGHQDVFFIYGVKNTERSSTDYTLNFFSGDELVNTRQFTLKKGESVEEGVSIDFPKGTTFPDKISLLLISGKAEENVHLWIH
jgi:hypothetical protein